ncbi:MAG: hypothetical protein HYR74_07915 [Candidatus Eisenbacteria bacterium]|nr:hypothetical protein [Candidatus Eisenbacteria bacterium]
MIDAGPRRAGRRAAAPLLALAILGFAATARAHDATLFVSRDTTARARLEVDGPGDILSGATPIALQPGDAGFSGYWIADAPGIATLSEDGLIPGRRRLRAGHRVALELVRADSGFAMADPVTFHVALARAGERYEFFRDARGDFTTLMISRMGRPGACSATFRFIDRSGLHAPSQPFTLRFTTGVAADAPVATPAATLTDAVRDLRLRIVDAESAIADRRMSRVGGQASAIGTLAGALPNLAHAPGAGLDPRAITIVSAEAATIGTAARPLHQAADFGDSSGASAALVAMSVAVDSLMARAPRRFACPMGCEAAKTYARPGRCPVCGARLMDAFAHLDHRPRHGGELIMSPDFEHHVECVAAAGELRVYFYDALTRPIAADAIRARVELPPTGGTPGEAIALAAAGEPGCMIATLPPSARTVREATLVVRFAGDAREQSYAVRLAPPRR